MDIDKINEAVRHGLDQCRGSDSVIGALAAFLAGLRAAGWSHYDVHAVEMGLLKVLNGIATTKMSRDKTQIKIAS